MVFVHRSVDLNLEEEPVSQGILDNASRCAYAAFLSYRRYLEAIEDFIFYCSVVVDSRKTNVYIVAARVSQVILVFIMHIASA